MYLIKRIFNRNSKQFNQDDFTLVIQGLFSSCALDSYRNNRGCFVEAVYSTWNNDLKTFNQLEDNLTFQIHDLPNIENKYNGANIYYQIVSTLEGLKNVKTPYAFKHRSDEKYKNLVAVLNQFNPDKLLCSNIFFRPLSYAPYHISDHFFVGRTKNLILTFENLKKYFDEGCKDKYGILENRFSSEQLIGLFYIASFEEFPISELLKNKKDKKFVFEVMKKYFDVFDIQKLKPYTVRHNHLKNVITDFKKVDKQFLIKYISKMSDIK